MISNKDKLWSVSLLIPENITFNQQKKRSMKRKEASGWNTEWCKRKSIEQNFSLVFSFY